LWPSFEVNYLSVKLKKRLPESRSQKKERLSADRDRRELDREQARDRREAWLAQHDRGKALYHEWRNATLHRLDSDTAYAHFESVHRSYWDLFRHIGMPSTELSLALQRHRDSKPVDPEPLVEELETQSKFRPHVAHLVKQLIREGKLSQNQKRRVGSVLVRRLAYDGWPRHFRALARLARALDCQCPVLRQQLTQLPQTPQLTHLLEHLEQEARMTRQETRVASGSALNPGDGMAQEAL
jgi:polyhydroxyalkanoate synthesis regulator phasin